MKKIVIVLLGLSLNAGWAGEVKQLNTATDSSSSSIRANDYTQTSSPKFSNLVKSTMEVMKPDLEISQADTDNQIQSK